MKKNKVTEGITLQEARLKAASYCAYQDRTFLEVKDKLYGWGLRDDEIKQIISFLVKENFLDEGRFARNYARGKFQLKKWGKNKIIRNLRMKNISEEDIQEGLGEIEDQAYIATIFTLINKKIEGEKKINLPFLKQKVIKYMLNKGYEYDLIRSVLTRQIDKP